MIYLDGYNIHDLSIYSIFAHWCVFVYRILPKLNHDGSIIWIQWIQCRLVASQGPNIGYIVFTWIIPLMDANEVSEYFKHQIEFWIIRAESKLLLFFLCVSPQVSLNCQSTQTRVCWGGRFWFWSSTSRQLCHLVAAAACTHRRQRVVFIKRTWVSSCYFKLLLKVKMSLRYTYRHFYRSKIPLTSKGWGCGVSHSDAEVRSELQH